MVINEQALSSYIAYWRLLGGLLFILHCAHCTVQCTYYSIQGTCYVVYIYYILLYGSMGWIDNHKNILTASMVINEQAPSIHPDLTYIQWRSEGPAGPTTAGAREAEWARQKEVVAVTSWPEAKTCSLRGLENRRYATAYISHTHPYPHQNRP